MKKNLLLICIALIAGLCVMSVNAQNLIDRTADRAPISKEAVVTPSNPINMLSITDYLDAYIGDTQNGSYCHLDLATGTRTPVGSIASTPFPSGEDYDGENIYRIHGTGAFGMILKIAENGATTSMGTLTGNTWTYTVGLAYDWIKNDGTWYFLDIVNSEDVSLYSCDMTTLVATKIGATNTGAGFMRGLSLADDGYLYSVTTSTSDPSSLKRFDPLTGVMTTVGSVGFAALYGYDLAYDRQESVMYWSPNNYTSGNCVFGILDVNTAAFTQIVSYGGGQQNSTMVICKVGGTCDPATNLAVAYNDDCEALLTWTAPGTGSFSYNIHRDGAKIATVATESYTDAGFNILVGHKWEVRVACEGGGTSPGISESLPKCDQGACNPPTNFNVAYTEDCSKAELVWGAPEKGMKITEPQIREVNNSVAKPETVQEALHPNAYTRNPNAKPALGERKPFVIPGKNDGSQALVVDAYPGNSEPASMILNNPGALNYLGGSAGYAMIGCGDWIEGEWWTMDCYNNNAVYKINPANGAYQYMFDHDAPDLLLGMAYDNATSTTYVSINNIYTGDFYTIDLTNGHTEYAFTSQIPIIAFVITNDGRFIAVDLQGSRIVEINPATGACTTLMNAPVTLAYIQDMALDRSDNTIYWAAYNTSISRIYKIDLDNNTLINLGDIANHAEIMAFVIPATSNPEIAKAPSPFEVTPAGLQLKAKIDWTNPTENAGGEPLTNITKIVLERDGAMIQEFTSVAPGQQMSYIDDGVPSIGNHCYAAYAVTDAGNGMKGSDCGIFGLMCNINFEMWDDYGDGWNGGTVSISVDGEDYGNVTLSGGNYGTTSVLVPSGEIVMSWTPGAYDCECEFEVTDDAGEVLYHSPENGGYPCETLGVGMYGISGIFYSDTHECEYVPVMYSIYRDDEKIAGPTEDPYYTDEEFASTAEHTWAVIVECNGGGESTAAIQTLPPCIVAPCNPVTDIEGAYDPDAKEMVITWTAPELSVPAKYEIYKDDELIGESTTTEYGDDASDLEAGDYEYNYCVLPIYNSGACEGDVAQVCEKITFKISIKEFTHSVSIVPNPAHDKITIKAGNTFHTVEIVSFLGQTILSQSNDSNTATIDVSQFTGGVYFVRVVSEVGTSVQKFVKQ